LLHRASVALPDEERAYGGGRMGDKRVLVTGGEGVRVYSLVLMRVG